MSSEDDTIARFIGGDKPSPWLCVRTPKAREMLVYSIKAEREYPHRKKLQARLKRLATAIDTIREAERDFDLMTLLRAGDGSFLNEYETCHGLADLAKRVKETLRDIPVRKGRDKFFGRPAGPTPQQICALIVSILWEEFHTAAPPNTKTEAQEACAALWKAAGGPLKRGSRKIRWQAPTDSPSAEVWRDYLRAAKDLAHSPECARLKRSLLPIRKDRAVNFDLPRIETARDVPKALASVLSSVASGDLTLSEAGHVVQIVDSITKALELRDLEARVAAIEKQRPNR